MSLIIPFSQACERNKDPILDVLGRYLDELHSVLEIGSGTAQHAIHFARQQPNVFWQTSDQIQHHPGILAQLENSALGNIGQPLALDVTQPDWGCGEQRFDAVYTANTLHIMDWQQVCAFFTGLEQVSVSGTYLFIYGPFKKGGKFTSLSNHLFDDSLRARDIGSAIRDFEKVDQLAQAANFRLLEEHSMPANNQCLIWKKA